MAAAWRTLLEARERVAHAAASEDERRRRVAEAEALCEALDQATLAPGEDAALRAERERLRHVDELYAAAAGAAERINPDDGAGALTLVGEAARALARAAALDAGLEEPASALRDAHAQLQEAARELRRYAEGLEAEPGRLEVVEGRLELLSDLLRRFAATSLGELLQLAEEARALLAEEQSGQPLTARLLAELEAAEGLAVDGAVALHALRREAAEPFCRAVEGHLADLGMEAARL